MQAMERRSEGPQTPYEVYCYHCHVTFAAGTARCVHCGHRMGRGSGGPAASPEGLAIPDTVEDPTEPSIGRRLGGMSLWILIALGAAITRICGGNG